MLSKYTKYYFKPKEDITAFELAIILTHLSLGYSGLNQGIDIDEEYSSWKNMSDNVKRHFERVKT